MLEGADSVIAVLFGQPVPMGQADAQDIWATLFEGTKPDSYNRNIAAPLPLSTATGRWDEASVQITVQPGRVDLAWTKPPADEMQRPQQFADITKAVETASITLKKLVASMKPVRLALVANTSSKTGDLDPAQALSSLLGRVYFPPNATDSLYRLNVQRDISYASGLKLNRLSTWQTGVQQLVAFDNGSSAPLTFESCNYVAHNIDVNTLGIINVDTPLIERIVDELSQEATQILKQGVSFYG